jgi:outer membrane protein OmpA-like peptidoglycan-associated protein
MYVFLCRVATALMITVSTAYAQNEPLTKATVDDLVDRLTPPEPKTRGLLVKPAKPDISSVNLAVRFEYDSARLTDDAREILDTLARALSSSELRPYRFKIIGYTDASGTDEYNHSLSERRAAAVESYLTGVHGIDISRFETEGFGESRLLFPETPFDAKNRRVEIKTIK